MADRSLGTLTPGAAHFPATAAAQLLLVNRRPALAFDQTTVEGAYWQFRAPVGITTPLKAVIQYIMASATSGLVDFEVAVEAISDGDAVDLDASTSFDTANTITAPTVPSTAGYLDEVTCTLTNADSIVAGDYVRIRLERDADDATNDTATGDAYVLNVEILDNGG